MHFGKNSHFRRVVDKGSLGTKGMRLTRRLVASNRCGDWRERTLKIEGKAGGRVIFPNISVTQNYYLLGARKAK